MIRLGRSFSPQLWRNIVPKAMTTMPMTINRLAKLRVMPQPYWAKLPGIVIVWLISIAHFISPTANHMNIFTIAPIMIFTMKMMVLNTALVAIAPILNTVPKISPSQPNIVYK